MNKPTTSPHARQSGFSQATYTMSGPLHSSNRSRPQKGHAIKAALMALLLLSACETIPPPPMVVSVPVAVSCITTTPARPFVHTDPQLATLDDFKFTLAIFSDRRSLLDYSAELEAVLQACK